MRLVRKVFNRIRRFFAWLAFRRRYPAVPIVQPLATGTYYSQEGQDLYLSSILFNYLRNHPRAWIVDVGANHPEYFSNSLYFEKFYGCRTLAIDALAEFGEVWATLRPDAVFRATALGSSEGAIVLKIPVGGDSMLTAVDGGVQKLDRGASVEERNVPVTRLATLFAEQGIDTVALMSVDVEGFELEVLKGIDFNRVDIKAILVENNSGSLYGDEPVRELLRRHGYVFFSRIGFLDDLFLHSSILNGLKRI